MAAVETMTLCGPLDHCNSDCKSYTVPLNRCFSPPVLFPGDPQWGASDVFDTCNATHIHRTFFASTDGTCDNSTSGFTDPLHQCVGPFGKPRPWGSFFCGAAHSPPVPPPVPPSVKDEALCRSYTKAHANETWRQASGVLKYPYLVPAGPYTQCWDWDSVFLGTATLGFGSSRYLAGAMMNFFEATNVTDGVVTGCLTRTLPTVCSSSTSQHDALAHAKPILIQVCLSICQDLLLRQPSPRPFCTHSLCTHPAHNLHTLWRYSNVAPRSHSNASSPNMLKYFLSKTKGWACSSLKMDISSRRCSYL